jgi:hypothetical protein
VGELHVRESKNERFLARQIQSSVSSPQNQSQSKNYAFRVTVDFLAELERCKIVYKMSKKQARELVEKLLPRLNSVKQRLALFTLMLVLALAPMEFDSVHLHVEMNPGEITVTNSLTVSGNTATVTHFSVLPFDTH